MRHDALVADEVRRANDRYTELVEYVEQVEKQIRLMAKKALKEHDPVGNHLSSVEIVELLLKRIHDY